MTRSKEAIQRRAAKRGVEEAEQRIRDNPGAKKQKGSDGEAVTTIPDAVQALVKASVVKAPAKAVVSDDWICTKCNNKNFAARSNWYATNLRLFFFFSHFSSSFFFLSSQ